MADVVETKYGEIRSRSGAQLRFTVNDAEAIYDKWKAHGGSLGDDFHVLLVDPTLRQVEEAIRRMSNRIADCHADAALDLCFAGHGLAGSGDLVLKGGKLSPTRLLDLQMPGRGRPIGARRIGVFLDSCYSGAFLVRLAVEAMERLDEFRLDEGLASCLPNERCFEFPILEHGVFTYTHLNPGNANVNSDSFNRAILENDEKEIAKGVQGLVGMMSNASAFLTEGRQFAMSLTKHVIDVAGGFARVELDKGDDVSHVCGLLTQFRRGNAHGLAGGAGETGREQNG